MWISTLHLEPKHVLLTKLLGLFYPDIYYSSLSPLQVRNLPRQPLPSPGWVRVRNRLAGICGSDLHLIFADADPRIAPAALPGHPQLYPGHEVVGEVIEIGDDVQHLRVGDRVVLQNSPNCLSTGIYSPCRSCAAGNYNLCEQGVLPGPQPIGGGWSEEMLLHEQQLFRLPSQLSDEQAVLLEPTAVAVHAVLRHLPRPSDRVLIIGSGTIGLLTLQVIRALVPQVKVSMLARYAPQREQAKRMGATYLIHPTDSYGEMQQVTGAQLYRGVFGNRTLLGGYDVIYDTVGHRDTLYDALRWARAQATIVLVGVSLHMMHIDLTPIWHQQINLLGTTSHGMEIWPPQTKQRISTFSLAAELMAQDRIHPQELITHRFALKNYKDALISAVRKARSHAIKVVFDYSLQPASAVPDPKAILRTPLPLSANTGALKALPLPISTGTLKALPTPLPTSTGALKALPKPVKAISHDHAKDELRQLRRSLGLGSDTDKVRSSSSGENQPEIKVPQRSQSHDIPEEYPSSAAKAIEVPVDGDQLSLSTAETISEISSSDQITTDTINVQGSITYNKSDILAGPVNAPVQEEQASSMDETPIPTVSDKDPTSKLEAAQMSTNPMLDELLPIAGEDIRLTIEEDLLENGHAAGNGSAGAVKREENEDTTQLIVEEAQHILTENGHATSNGSVGAVKREENEDTTQLIVEEAQHILTENGHATSNGSVGAVKREENEDTTQLIVEEAQHIPIENGHAVGNGSAGSVKREENEDTTQLIVEETQHIPTENGHAAGNGSAGSGEAEKKEETISDNDVFSFPEVENTPTVQVRSRRGSRKRKTKPFV